MQKIWIELPELVELGWKKDLRDLCYYRQISKYNGVFITFTVDKIILETPLLTFEQMREEDLVGQIERMMEGIEVY